jgi:hypothetical protein
MKVGVFLAVELSRPQSPANAIHRSFYFLSIAAAACLVHAVPVRLHLDAWPAVHAQN